jgi:hypothetical protein
MPAVTWTPARQDAMSWLRHASVRMVIMGVMALIAVLAGCSRGGTIDTSAPARGVTAAASSVAAGGDAGGASGSPSGTGSATAAPTLTSPWLPSGAYVSLARNLAAFDRTPAVVAMRLRVDKRLIALVTRNALYGPLAATESGPLLERDRTFIARMRPEGITLYGRSYYSIVQIRRESATEVILSVCSKDDAAYFVDKTGKPMQAVVTKNWIPHLYRVSFVGGRWVPTDLDFTKPSFSCAAAV